MADSILKIRTQDGDKPIGYPGLADKPVADKTLEIEGAFADSKEVGERFAKVNETTNSLKEDLGNQKDFIYLDGLKLKKEIKTGKTIIVDKEMKNITTNSVVINSYHSNRFDYTKLSTDVNSYNSSHTITKEKNGLKIVRNTIETSAYIMNLFEYTAEFTGLLWFSCDVEAKNIIDVMIKLKVNDSDKESIYGNGHVYACIPVNVGDIVKLQFYTDLGNTTTGNVIYYSNIMLQYGEMTDKFIPYIKNSDNSDYLTKAIIFDGINFGKIDDWTTMNAASGKYYFISNNIIPDILAEAVPKLNTDMGDWESNYNKLTSATVQSGVEDGVGLFTNKKIGIYINSVQSRSELVNYLKTNPISVTYKYSKEGIKTIDPVTVGDVLVSENEITLVGYCKEKISKTIEYVAMGDSITGMFAYGTSYPEMIARKNKKVVAYNCGFSGSQVTDHLDKNYKAFSFNRLVDNIINGDWNEQNSAVKNISSAHYYENLERLKTIDFAKVDYLSLFYGTNDWGANKNLEDFKNTYISSIKKMLEAYPNLKIIVISPYWRSVSVGKDSNIDRNENGNYLYEFSDEIENLAKKNFNCPTLNLYWNLGANAVTNRYFTQDGTHPTFNTRKIIAGKINSLISERT